mmetsp:Transcript_11403/g.18560  ORF Transcript_11403/g.18560 Transcript_11403/m.18560 type:complete len:87 (+) Transcript_11403:240-500(+)
MTHILKYKRTTIEPTQLKCFYQPCKILMLKLTCLKSNFRLLWRTLSYRMEECKVASSDAELDNQACATDVRVPSSQLCAEDFVVQA